MKPSQPPPGFCRVKWDTSPYVEIVDQNCYRLPDKAEPGQVVVDIGAHIGCFTCEALDRGFDRVFAFEADPRNFSQLCRNVTRHRDYARVEVQWGAVWRSDRPLQDLRMAHQFDLSDPDAVTSVGSVAFNYGSGDFVPAHSLRSILQRLDQLGIKKIDFLKSDCEGSEYPILYSAPDLLDRVDKLAVEVHVAGFSWNSAAMVEGHENTAEGMEKFLRGLGFQVEVTPGDNPRVAYVFANR